MIEVPKAAWSVLCRKAVIDRDDNGISLLEAAESMGVPAGLPVPAPDDNQCAVIAAELHFATLWVRTEPEVPEVSPARLVLITPDGRQFPQRPITIDLTENRLHRTIAKTTGIPYRGPGRYRWIMELQDPETSEWRVASDVPLEVTSDDEG